MQALAVLPLVLCAIMLTMLPAERVFLYLFFPFLLAVPTGYYFPLPGLPDLNFFHFAALPIICWWIFRGVKEHQLSFMDLLVFSYAMITIVSEFYTMGVKDGINIVIDRVMQIFIPYILLKHFFRYNYLRVPILKVIVVIGAGLALLSLPEFKFDIAVTDPLNWLWPENIRLPGLPRYGFVRVAATFTHPILAGLMWAFFTLFAVWLHKQRVWQNTRFGLAMIVLNVGGLILSISRGPMLGLVAGLVVLYIGWNSNRVKALTLVLTATILVAPPVVIKFVEYVSIDRFNAVTSEQENAAYRKELLDNYIDVIKESPWIGYGIQGVPVVGGQRSVDNQYLFIALRHGVFSLGLFIAITLYVIGRLAVYGWKTPPDHSGGMLAWALIGCAGTWFLTLATVWMGAQSEQMVFLVAAMADTFGREVGTVPESVALTPVNSSISEWSFQRAL
ncbi:MAG: O-antigen ligase family protein [Desulfobulbaceae bacterium]|nr:O-antigen ligase family protein [Desulfobulbaceae bacterium]